MKIYPSILEENLEKFTAQFHKLASFFDHFQIDIADGEFVPHKTVQIKELEEGIGRWGDGVDMRTRGGDREMGRKTFEFHLMVQDIDAKIEEITALSRRIHITRTLVHIKPFLNSSLPRLISSSPLNLALVLSPEDAVAPNWETISTFDTIQLMTVEPGRQGNLFIPQVLEKIDTLRAAGYTGEIILDGGINDKTLPIILKNKHLPDAVCPGSYLHENVAQRLASLRSLL